MQLYIEYNLHQKITSSYSSGTLLIIFVTISINYQNLKKLQKSLETKLEEGCQRSVEILRDNTPIDTKRLWESTRHESVTSNGLVSECKIIAGGESRYGVLRETDIKRDVDYAIFVESRTGYARQSLVAIKNAIVNSLTS